AIAAAPEIGRLPFDGLFGLDQVLPHKLRLERLRAGPEGAQLVRDRPGQVSLRRRRDAPATGHRLDRFLRSIGVQAGAEMADLGGADARAAVNLPADDQPAA